MGHCRTFNIGSEVHGIEIGEHLEELVLALILRFGVHFEWPVTGLIFYGPVEAGKAAEAWKQKCRPRIKTCQDYCQPPALAAASDAAGHKYSLVASEETAIYMDMYVGPYV